MHSDSYSHSTYPTLMLTLLSVLLGAVSEQDPVTRRVEVLTHQQDIGSGRQLGALHLLTLPHKRQPVIEGHILLWIIKHRVTLTLHDNEIWILIQKTFLLLK